jgi:exonuclease VII small subunit
MSKEAQIKELESQICWMEEGIVHLKEQLIELIGE